MKKLQITLSKTVKLPIPGVQFSSKQPSVTIVYDAEGFDINEAVEELNQMLTIVKDEDPEWIRQTDEKEVKT